MPIKLIKELYYEGKLSTLEIAEKLRVSPWVVIKFMRRMNLPRRTLAETNRIVFERSPVTFRIKQSLSVVDDKLRIAGIMIYWSEGARLNPITRAATVDLANSNPRMVRLFLKFLRRICGIDENRLRVLLYCYADQDQEALKRYWSQITEINLKQFSKPYVRKDFLPEKKGKMKYGLVHIRYCDKKLLIQIEKWIEDYLRINDIRAGTEVDKLGSL